MQKNPLKKDGGRDYDEGKIDEFLCNLFNYKTMLWKSIKYIEEGKNFDFCTASLIEVVPA